MSLPAKRAAASRMRMALMALRRQSPPALSAAAMSHAYPYVMGTMASRSALSSSSHSASSRPISTASTRLLATGTCDTRTSGLPTVYKFRSDLLLGPGPINLYQQQQHRFKSAVVDHPDDDHHGSTPVAGGFDAEFFTKIANVNRKAYDNITRHAIEVLKGHVHDRKSGNQLQILDLASGPGEPAASLSNAFTEATIYSTDINPAMVKEAQERLRESTTVPGTKQSRLLSTSFTEATRARPRFSI